MILEFSVGQDGLAVEDVLKQNGVSRRLILKLKREPMGICVNGNHARTIDKVSTGDVVSISHSDTKTLEGNESLCVPIIYEDEYFIIFDKPGNMPVHPSIKHQGDTLGNYFSYLHPSLTFRPVNRLDRDTSGLCCVAKDAYSAKKLQYNIHKRYSAVVCGRITEASSVDLPIAREKDSIIKRCIRQDGQEAKTLYTPIKTNDRYTLLELTLITGRTHQIRVHMSAVGYPLAGDDMYGGECTDIHRQALHCSHLSVKHPVTDEQMEFDSPLPEDISSLIY